MKKSIFFLLTLLLCSAPAMAGGLETFLDNMNVQASADRHGMLASVGSHFGVPYSDVELIVGTTGNLADAFMVLQMGRMTGWPTERVMGMYKKNKGRGWGVMAKEMGIKPGSAQFHALKNGEFGYSSPHARHDGSKSGGKGDSHGKSGGKGKNGQWEDDEYPQGKGGGKKK